ncbi:RT0821/Lpp0805 family surface protein [Thiogranum longum]|jgi:surface antigen
MAGKTFFATALACTIGLNACTYPGQGRNEQAGMVVGGVLGGLLGSEYDDHHGHGRTAAIILGTLAGAAIGGAIGRSMDDTDRLKTAHALENVRTGVPSTWRNPDTGNAYAVTSTRTFETAGGPCREYTIDAQIGGRTEQVYGTACRQADGSWRVQN